MEKSVCIVGAGMCGLVSLKCMKDAGFSVKCFEKDKFVAGRWNKQNSYPIARSTVTNLPKSMSCYSDFPLKENLPLYISADSYAEYFKDYAENFKLLPFINFENEVVKAESLNNFGESNYNWRVYYKQNDGDEIKSELFHYLVVSSGYNTTPYIPEKFSSAIKNFTGEVMHSIDFKNSEDFKDKNVVVCGLGNTGGIAIDYNKKYIEICAWFIRTFKQSLLKVKSSTICGCFYPTYNIKEK